MMNISKFNTFENFGGGYYSAERRQALGSRLLPRLPKGGQRRSPDRTLIDREGATL